MKTKNIKIALKSIVVSGFTLLYNFFLASTNRLCVKIIFRELLSGGLVCNNFVHTKIDNKKKKNRVYKTKKIEKKMLKMEIENTTLLSDIHLMIKSTQCPPM